MALALAIDPAERREQLLDRLADPKTVESLNCLLDKLDVVVFAVEALDEFLRRGDELMVNASSGFDELRKMAATVDMAQVRRTAQGVPKLAHAVEHLSDSGVLEPEVLGRLVGLVQSLSTATAVANEPAPRQYGTIALAMRLRDPDVNRALNFTVRLAKAFGQELK